VPEETDAAEGQTTGRCARRRSSGFHRPAAPPSVCTAAPPDSPGKRRNEDSGQLRPGTFPPSEPLAEQRRKTGMRAARRRYDTPGGRILPRRHRIKTRPAPNLFKKGVRITAQSNRRSGKPVTASITRGSTCRPRACGSIARSPRRIPPHGGAAGTARLRRAAGSVPPPTANPGLPKPGFIDFQRLKTAAPRESRHRDIGQGRHGLGGKTRLRDRPFPLTETSGRRIRSDRIRFYDPTMTSVRPSAATLCPSRQ